MSEEDRDTFQSHTNTHLINDKGPVVLAEQQLGSEEGHDDAGGPHARIDPSRHALENSIVHTQELQE
jgi:hypothetical protein